MKGEAAMVTIAAPRLVIPDKSFDSRGIASLRVVGDKKLFGMRLTVTTVDTEKFVCELRPRDMSQSRLLEWLLDWCKDECRRRSTKAQSLELQDCRPVNDPRRQHVLNVVVRVRRRRHR